MFTLTRREEIQCQLQRLRETRERELAAFDAVAAAHPELSASAIMEVAQKKAAAEVQLSLPVGDAVVSVGERVRVKDDIHLLHRADRGYFAADPLKPVYLGEKGEVVRVMRSFQGKPAVELRFADGITKIFFVECLALGRENVAPGVGTSSCTAARHTDPAQRAQRSLSVKGLPAPSSPPRVVEPLGWDHLCMPHRRPSAPSITDSASVPEALPPPPPPTVAAVRNATTKRGELASARVPSFSPAPAYTPSPAAESVAKKATSEVRKRPTAAAPVFRAVLKKEPMRGPCQRPFSGRADSRPASKTEVRAQLNSLSTIAMCSFVEEGLGLPMSVAPLEDVPHRARAVTDLGSIPDLRPTPDSSSCDIDLSVGTSAAVPSAAAEILCDDASGATPVRLHEASAIQDQPSFDLRNELTRTTGRRSSGGDSSGTRFCWLAGLTGSGSELGKPLRIALQPQCTTMFAVFAAVTRRLRWDTQKLTATRLFTDDGFEIKSADGVQGGMRLVATTGCVYRPEGLASHFAAVGDPRRDPTATSRVMKPLATRSTTTATNTAFASSATLNSSDFTATLSSTSASPPRTAARAPKLSINTTAPKRVAPPPSMMTKPIHIRVYENGVYDDNIYRTVTVRPTCKTLSALRSIITRELQWRDGKRVCLLFDVSGAEVVELGNLHDGDIVVASAGDRFSIPYPNTAIHREALKLSERLR
ncbi:hypothetical protein JKF63_00415 [Porcisia hertigi]|uniref:Doublecortin domain-containing protein n=1 Tax=Porcisia hertigi TaxID=2761500 RepID=A0A836L117_9TRYP|nr:hypothetical protein JKF63_00415 [Porcisia hertigi]